MALQNRVMPWGEIVADPARGTLTGNRGILHDDRRQLGSARWRHKAWISCRLHWRDVRRVVMTPGTWTELFFLDEAVALAAGHRPCGYCRREAYRRFQAAWEGAGLGIPRAPLIDAVLHPLRIRRDAAGATHHAPAEGLPDGCFIFHAGVAARIAKDMVVPFRPGGYGAPLPRPSGTVPVLTPGPMVAVLAAGYCPDGDGA
jgi:hypothetical protein